MNELREYLLTMTKNELIDEYEELAADCQYWEDKYNVLFAICKESIQIDEEKIAEIVSGCVECIEIARERQLDELKNMEEVLHTSRETVTV